MVNRPFRDGWPVHKDTATESQWLYLNLSVSPPGPHSWPLWCMSTHPSGRKKSPRHALLSWNQKTTPLQDGKGEGWDSKAGLWVALLLYEWGCNSRQNVRDGFCKMNYQAPSRNGFICAHNAYWPSGQRPSSHSTHSLCLCDIHWLKVCL